MLFCGNTKNMAAYHDIADKQGKSLAISVLALFYLAHNLGTVLFQARGVPQGQSGGAVIGYFAGVALGVLGMAFLEGRRGWGEPGKPGAALRALLFAGLAFPGLFCLISFWLAGYGGTPFLNTFQPLLWAMSLPVALRFFFANIRPGAWALYFALAISAGHLCWSLLTPLVGAAGPGALAGNSENPHLAFLNVTRSLLCFAFSFLCWKLAGLEARFGRPGYAGRGACRPSVSDGRESPGRRFFLLLLPFLACFFLNGFSGYLFFPRLLGRGLYPEYMHLFLTLAFPLLGLWVTRRGDQALFRLLAAACLIFASLPLLLFLPLPLPALQGVYLVCAVAQQLLLFCGALAFARFARSPRQCTLLASMVWLATTVAVPGRLLASHLLPSLAAPPLAAACLLAALCALALLPLRRAFPLPSPPGPRAADAGKLAAFAAAFGLTRRESELMALVAEGAESERIRRELGVSENTVKYHMRGLLQKCVVPNRQQLLHLYTAWKQD